jgi:hypothetical protein
VRKLIERAELVELIRRRELVEFHRRVGHHSECDDVERLLRVFGQPDREAVPGCLRG